MLLQVVRQTETAKLLRRNWNASQFEAERKGGAVESGGSGREG